MKKLTKLLILVLSLALICGIFAVAAFAEEAGEGSESTEITTGWVYTTDGTTYAHSESLKDAISGAKAGTTVTMVADTELSLSSNLSIGKDLTIDLNGNTLYLVHQAQAGFKPSSGKPVTMKNGTIVVSSGASYNSGSNQSNKDNHAIFASIPTGSTINFENVNTYGYALSYSYDGAYTINVTGGEHHVYTSYANFTYPGWICGNNNINATVTGATVYLDSSDAVLFGFQNYKNTDVDSRASTATVDNCSIIAYAPDKAIIGGWNSFSTATFTNCEIYGKLAPGNTTNDGDYKTPVNGSIIIGAGCIVSSNVGTNSVVKWADGITPVEVSHAEVLYVNEPSGYYSNGDFAITSMYKSKAMYAYADSAVDFSADKVFLAENADCFFTITAGDKTYYTDDIYAALSYAPAGATVTLNKDHVVYAAASIGNIKNALTLDLNGKTLTISQSDFDGYITIAANDTVTVKNGTLIAACNNDIFSTLKESLTRGLDRAIPVFVAYDDGDASTNPAVDLVIEGVNTYTGAIFHNESATGSKLTVNGGVHQTVAVGTKFTINGTTVSAMSNGGLLQSRTNTTAVFNNVKIWMNYCSSIFTSSHSKQTNASITNKTEIIYNNSVVVQNDTNNKHLILVSNANTYVYFNATDVYGPLIVPGVENSETVMGTDNIVFGMNSSHGYSTSGATSALITPTVADGVTTFEYSPTIKIQDAAGMVAINGNFHRKDLPTAPFVGTSAINKSYTASKVYGTPAFEIVKDGETIQRPYNSGYTLYTAISDADAGTTVKLLADYTIETAKSVADITKELTLDLNGYTITVVQEHQNAYFNVKANVTIKNGTLVAGANDSYTNIVDNKNITDPHNYAAPLFRTNTVCDLVFENITFYGSIVVYNYGQRAETPKVSFNNFNYYGMYYQADATAPTLVDSRGNIAVTVTNSNLYLDKASLFSSLHNKVTGADTVKKSTFDFINTKIYSPDTSKSLIANASNRTFVTFTNCDIIGRFSPALNSWDKNAGDNVNGVVSAAMPATNIVFNEGCRWGYTGTSALIPTYANGAIYYGDSTSSNSYSPSSGCFIRYQNGIFGDADDIFAIPTTATALTATYKYSSSLVEGVTYQYKVTKGGQTIYLPDTYTLKQAIDLAEADSDVTDDVATLVLLKDLVHNMTADINPGKNLTIDLGGYTMYIAQDGIPSGTSFNGFRSFVTSKSLKFANGTIVIAASTQYGTNNANKMVGSIVQPNAGATIYFKNVNTYGGAITYSWSNAYSVYVDGGEHHVYQKHANITYAGFICGNDNITAEVKDATIYLDHKETYLVGFQNYKVDSGVTPKSSAWFYNCTIVDNDSTYGIIKGLNKYSTITFEKCDIIGKIAPGNTDHDKTGNNATFGATDNVPVAGSIVIGTGCRFTDETIGNNTVVVLANGVKLYDADVTKTLTVKSPSSLWNVDGFELTTTTKSVTFNLSDVTTVTGVDFVFEYTKGGKTYQTPEVDADTFNGLFTHSDTIKLLKDYTWKSTSVKYVQRDIVLDLNGFTLTHQQAMNAANNYIAGYLEFQTGTLTIKNGTIVTSIVEGTNAGKSYPFIRMSNSSVYKSITLNIENVNTYGGTFLYNMDARGVTINVTGGEHYLTNGYANVSGSFIESRANAVVTVTGAKFYISDKVAGLVVSMSYKQTTGDKASSFTFTDCELYAATATKNIVPNSNKFTTFEFNNCKIVGSIAPSLHSFDGKVDVPADGSVVLGIGTTYISGSKLSCVISAATPAITPDTVIEITFSDVNYGTKTASGTVLKIGYTVAGDVAFSVIVNGESIGEYATLDAAIAAAPAGATIKLLKDLTIDAYGTVAIINKAITIDLDGKLLQIVQHASGAHICINTTDAVVITNGRISCAAGAEFRNTLTTTTSNYDVGEPIFAANSVAVDLTLNGVSTYSAGILYNTVSGSEFTVIGGYHKQCSITYEKQNDSGKYINRALVISKANITVLFQGASIDMDWCGSLLVSTSQNEASYETALSTFTYENCQVYFTGSNNQIIRGANDKTFVYFKDSDVYGAFVQPTNTGSSKFTSANLHFDANCTWGYPELTGVTLLAPTIPEGYTLIPISGDATEINFVKYATDGNIHKGTFTFAASATTGSFTITYKVAQPGDLLYEVTTGGKVTYFDDTISFAQLLEVVAADSTIKFLGDVTYTSSAAIKIKKNLTFDLGGYTLTFYHATQNNGLEVHSKIKLTFMNGNIVNAPAPGSAYETSNLAFAFIYVNAANTELVFTNVNATISALTYSYGSPYTITITGGRYDLAYGYGGMNTAGFISGQANIDATVTGATIYTKDGYIVGASSYRQFASYSGKETDFESAKAGIKSTYVFEDCTIIAKNSSKNIIANVNEFTHIEFNGCTIYGSFEPTQNKSDLTYTYVQVGNRLYTSPAKCTCDTFNDTNGDGKCDDCSNYDPAEIKTYAVKPIAEGNIVIGKGTIFNNNANFDKYSVFDEYLVAQPVSISKDINGTTYTFNRQADYIKVIWYDENGEVIKTVNIDANFTSVSELAPEYEGVGGITNGWYKIGGYIANAWTDKLDGTTALDLTKINAKDLTANLVLYPQANGDKISAYLSAAMYNLSITGAIRNNFYIPATPDNVEILRVYNEKGEEIKGTLVLYREHDGTPIYYTMYVVGEVGAAEFTKVTNIYVEYKVNGSITLTQEYNLSPEKYANTVYKDSLKTEGNKYNTKAYNVVADLVRYSYLLSVYAKIDADELTAITNLYNKMSGLCTKLPVDNDMAGSTTNVSDLEGSGSIAYEASSFEPRWKFTLNASAQITGIKITLDGYNNGVLDDRTNFGPKTYGVEDVTVDANGYIISAYTQNIPIYNMVQEFTITFTKADGSEISGTYDLKSYYTATGKNTAAADFLKSVVALANSTVAYKFPEGKITVDDIADFWDCDHAGVTEHAQVTDGIYNFKPNFCEKCDSWIFYYEDYGAVYNGKAAYGDRKNQVSGDNDYEAIYWTHANANEWKERTDLSLGKHVAVVGNSDPTTVKNYYISLPEGRGIYEVNGSAYKNGQNLGSIVIATDTSWNGVYFIVDDNAICNAGTSCDCGRTHKSYRGQNIFQVDEYGSENVVYDLTGKITSLEPGATKIEGYTLGYKALVYIVNNEHKIWYRYGDNASNGVAANEVILVDEFGNIDPTTPIQWDYSTLSTIKAYKVDTDPIKISGLDASGEINSFFESYVNNDPRQSIPSYTSCGRNITIQRSNATVEGIHHYFTEEVSDGSGDNVERFAYTFIVVQWCNNPTVKDMIVKNHNSEAAEDNISQGSYEFSGSDANAISWINCRTVNMFSSNVYDGDELTPYVTYRGLFGTNRLRNMYLKDCFLNSYDAHTGAHNVTIEDSTFDHMNFVGGGEINLKNVTIYTSKGHGAAINLRSDYGSIWQGDLNIDGLTVMYASVSSYKPAQISLFEGTYEKEHYFGRDTYMPQNVVINNFHVQQYTASVTDGVRTETLGARDSGIQVYYYYALKDLDFIYDESAPGTYTPKDEKQQENWNLDCGNNHLEVTKNLTITNSVSINLPTGEAWHGMNVTIDGNKWKVVEKTFYGISLGWEWKKQ